MRTPILLVGAVLTAVACTDSPSAPSGGAVAPGRPQLAAVVVTDSEVIPLELSAFVPCANGSVGETVFMDGKLHVVSHTTVLASGKLTARLQFQPQGGWGVGATSGDTYRATGITQETLVLNGDPPLSGTAVNNFRLIGPGRGNNFTVHEVFHVTVNANGELTVIREAANINCV